MSTLIHEAGASFLRAGLASLIVLLPGILAAPNLKESGALAVAASYATAVAALKALQVYVPKLSVGYLLTKSIGTGNTALEKIEDSFVRAFLGTLFASLIGLMSAPDFSFTKSAVIGLLVGAVSAAIRTIQGALTPGEFPAPSAGLATPPRR